MNAQTGTAPTGGGSDAAPGKITVRTIGLAALREALSNGWRDFRATASIGLVFGLFFAVGGLVIVVMVFWAGYIYLAYPTAAGFALVGPFAATVMYEVSRQLNAGETPSWSSSVGPALRQGRQRLSWLPMITLFGFIIWLDVAAAIYAIFFGLKQPELIPLLTEIFTTPAGLLFLVAGNVIGAGFAVTLFSISVMSYPLLMDREVDAVTAIITSVKAVRTNPVPLLGFGSIVALSLGVCIATAFVAMIAVLPFLGHTAWHLYRSTVDVAE